MAIHTFAAIYIGSYEVSLKIFEISARKNIRKIDYIRSRIELGRDAYSRGVIGYELVEALCDTLEQFTKIMKEYQVDGYEAYAAAALRDVSNELFILDQIRIRTGLTVHVLSNSEHRFISYKSVAMRSEFEELIKTGAAVVDVGGGGMQITIFSKGKVITTQHLGLGTIRMQEQLAKKSCSLEQYELQIEELVEKELNVFMAMFTEQVKVKNLIIIGDYIMEVAGKVTGKKHENLMETNDFLAFLDDLDKKTVEQISEELNLSNENDSLIIPYMIIFKCMARKMKAEKIWAPGVIVSDGIAYDYAQKHKLCKPVHDFDADVISAARNLSARYMSYSPHIDALTKMSTMIFQAIQKVHGMGSRELLLLQVAAILHDCGKFVSLANGPDCAYDIIMASEIIGLSHLEREIVASTVRYNTRPLDPYERVADKMDVQSYMTAAKLAAILRVSNALDRSHKQKFSTIKVVLKNKELLITVETKDDIILEKGLLANKSDSFEAIFGIKPVLREKRKL